MKLRAFTPKITDKPSHLPALGAAVLLSLSVAPSWAQDAEAEAHAGHGASAKTMEEMNHGAVSHDAMSMEMDMNMDDMSTMDRNGEMAPGMTHEGAALEKKDDMTDRGAMSMQGGAAPLDARDPHAYSGGHDFGPFPLRLADRHNFGALLVDRLEAVRADDDDFVAYDLQARYGRDYDRLVLKAEGDVSDGALEEGSTQLLWGHAVAPFWDTQLGLRYDTGEAPDQGWLAFGIQGLAPYWFEVDAAAYVGAAGRGAVSVEAEYELLLTQNLILQPHVEMTAYAKDDGERGLGSGLSDVVLGLRLRYEIRREFAPYIGMEWVGTYGGSADYARAAGKNTDEMRVVAGLRFWF